MSTTRNMSTVLEIFSPVSRHQRLFHIHVVCHGSANGLIAPSNSYELAPFLQKNCWSSSLLWDFRIDWKKELIAANNWEAPSYFSVQVEGGTLLHVGWMPLNTCYFAAYEPGQQQTEHFMDCTSNNRPKKDDKKTCKFRIESLGPCTKENRFGYDHGQPCVLLKLNKVKVSAGLAWD